MTKVERAEQLQLAYEMAWFIHRNKQVAYLIATEAVYRWEVLPPQGQRLLSKAQKFQRLVFEVSAYFEKTIEVISAGDESDVEEQVRRLVMNMRHLESTEHSHTIAVRKCLSLLTPSATNLEDNTMMTHYLKHLAMIALRHSLVKTTVSHLQLLYRFATNETRSIYEHLETFLEKSGEAKDLQFFAKARRELLDDLRNRFGDLLRIELCRAPNGATTHQLAALSATCDQTEFAEECLREFAPRDVRRSPCTPGKLRNKGEFIYQLFYPEQFRVVLAETGLSGVHQALFWPVFTNTQKPIGPASPRPSRPLHGREIRAALSRLSLAAKRRQRLNGRMLRIVVDGRDYTQFNLDEASQTTLQLGADTSTVEVLARTEEGDILLAQCLLSEEEFDPEVGPAEHVVRLGGGRKILFAIKPKAGGPKADGPEADGPSAERMEAEVTIKYQEPMVSRIMGQLNLNSPLSSLIFGIARPFLSSNPRLVASMIVLGLAVFLGVEVSQPLRRPHIINATDLAVSTLAPSGATAGGQSNGSTLGHIGGQPAESPPASPASEQRQLPTLCQISNLSIQTVDGDSQLNRAAEARLRDKLSSTTTGLVVVTGGQKPDAVLKLKAGWQYWIWGRVSDTALIEVGLYQDAGSERPQALWPPSTYGRQYRGNSGDVIDKIAQDLIEAKRGSCKN